MADYTKKELFVWIWNRCDCDVKRFLKEFVPIPNIDPETNEPMKDDEGYPILKMTELELTIAKDPSIVRRELAQWGIKTEDYFALGCDSRFDADMVDFLKCDPVVLKRKVLKAYLEHDRRRRNAKRRYDRLRKKSRELIDKAKSESKPIGKA